MSEEFSTVFGLVWALFVGYFITLFAFRLIKRLVVGAEPPETCDWSQSPFCAYCGLDDPDEAHLRECPEYVKDILNDEPI